MVNKALMSLLPRELLFLDKKNKQLNKKVSNLQKRNYTWLVNIEKDDFINSLENINYNNHENLCTPSYQVHANGDVGKQTCQMVLLATWISDK